MVHCFVRYTVLCKGIHTPVLRFRKWDMWELRINSEVNPCILSYSFRNPGSAVLLEVILILSQVWAEVRICFGSLPPFYAAGKLLPFCKLCFLQSPHIDILNSFGEKFTLWGLVFPPVAMVDYVFHISLMRTS